MEIEKLTIIPFASPWRQRLLTALTAVGHSLLLVSPFLKDAVIGEVERTLAARSFDHPLSIRVLCRIRLDDLLADASDLAALERIVEWPVNHPGWQVELRALDNVHAKVWVFDTHMALVGSGNATSPGLDRNVEYGVEVQDSSLVAQILADWQGPWDHAEPITGDVLMPFRQMADRVATDPQLRDAQATADRRREELATNTGVPSRLGGRFHFSPPIGEAVVRSAFPSSHSGEMGPTSTTPTSESVDLSQALDLRLDELWEAIRWIVPGRHTAQGYTVDLDPSSALKLIGEPTEIQTVTDDGKTVWLSPLRFVWADRVREAAATLPAIRTCRIEQASDQGSWAVTLNSQSIQQLIDALTTYEAFEPDVGPDFSSYKTVRFLTEPPYLRLHVEGRHITSVADQSEDEGAIAVRTTLDVTPAPWERGLKPIADPVMAATVDAGEVQSALKYLDEDYSRSVQGSGAPFEPVLVVQLSSDPSPLLVLKSVHREERWGRHIPLIDPRFRGPAVTFRLDRAAFDQMLHSGHTMIMRIDNDAAVIQFEVEYPVHFASFYPSLGWLYQLRSLE